jgi:hypothetical protein
MAGILAEEVNRPREVRAIRLDTRNWRRVRDRLDLDFAQENLLFKSKPVNGWRHSVASRLLCLSR